MHSTFGGSQKTIHTTGATSTRTNGRYQPKPTDFINSFYAVLNRLKSETIFVSDPNKISAHPSFRALVENAQLVTPLIIDELKLRPSFLVWVLDDAFQESPYSPGDIGNFQSMSEAWISWAEQNGRTL